MSKVSTEQQGFLLPKFRIEEDVKQVNLQGRRFLTMLSPIFNHSQIALCTFGDLANAIENKQVFAYNKNRGSGDVKESWAVDKANRFSPDGFGMPVLMDCGNNVYKIVEGHNRLRTVMYMKQKGMLKSFEDVSFPVQILSNEEEKNLFMEVYRTANTNHGHTITDKLTNSDYGFGREIDLFLRSVDNVKYKGIQIVRKDHIKQIALLLYGTTLKGDVLTFQELIGRTGTVTAKADMLPDEFDLNIVSQRKSALRDAFNFTLNVMKSVIDLTDQKSAVGRDGESYKASLTATAQHVVGSAMFFSLLTWDRYTDAGDLTSVDYKRIAKNLIDKAAWTDQQISLLSAKKSMGGAIHQFYQIIRTKRKKQE